jgi:hypothetical protein
MKPRFLRNIVFLQILFGCGFSYSQNAVMSTCGNASGTGGSSSYSIGQVAFITKTGNTGIITEGVQQPCEILFMQGINDPGITLESSVSPNPASEFIRLTIRNHELRTISCQITDMKGVLLQSTRITGEETIIPVDRLSPAPYLLTISENDYPVTVYKIIKK